MKFSLIYAVAACCPAGTLLTQIVFFKKKKKKFTSIGEAERNQPTSATYCRVPDARTTLPN